MDYSMSDAEYRAFVEDMEREGEAQLRAWEAAMEADADKDEAEISYLTLPTLCDGCPVFDAWMADQTFRAEAAYDWSVNR